MALFGRQREAPEHAHLQAVALYQGEFFLHQIVDADAAVDLEKLGADRVLVVVEHASQWAQGFGGLLQGVPGGWLRRATNWRAPLASRPGSTASSTGSGAVLRLTGVALGSTAA